MSPLFNLGKSWWSLGVCLHSCFGDVVVLKIFLKIFLKIVPLFGNTLCGYCNI